MGAKLQPSVVGNTGGTAGSKQVQRPRQLEGNRGICEDGPPTGPAHREVSEGADQCLDDVRPGQGVWDSDTARTPCSQTSKSIFATSLWQPKRTIMIRYPRGIPILA
jgi:hypothetical protein